MTNPPSPNPYRQRFPLAPSTTDGSPANNRSRYNDALIPDQDQEQYRPQPNMRHPPPLNPYAVSQLNHDPERRGSQPNLRRPSAFDPYAIPSPPATFASRGYGDNASPAPTYTTEDQNPQPSQRYRPRHP